MYATSLPPRRNPHARIAENYAPRFSPSELPLLPANWIPSWRSPPTKIWGDVGGNGGGGGGGGGQPGTAAAVAAAASCARARPSTTGSIRFAKDSSAREAWGSLRDDCTGRLHASQTHNISDRSIDSGLIPQHLLDGTIPPPNGTRASSLDYFPKSERPVPVPPIRMGHQFRLLREVPPKRLEEYKRGAVLPDGPVRIVRHTSKDRTYMKKSALRNPRGISRNVLGGFCTS